MLCYVVGIIMMSLRSVRAFQLPLRTARARSGLHSVRVLPPRAVFERALSSKVRSAEAPPATNGRAEVAQQPLFELAPEPAANLNLRPAASGHIDAPAREVSTREEARRVVEVLRRYSTPDRVHAVDTEVKGIDIKKSPLGQGHVTCVSIYSGPDVDFGSGPGEALWLDTLDPENGVLDELKGWLEDPAALKVWHNYGFDRHVLYNHGVDVQGFGGDTMHMARLWDAARKSGYSLETLTEEVVGRRKVPMKELFGRPKLKKDGTPGKMVAALIDAVKHENTATQREGKSERLPAHKSKRVQGGSYPVERAGFLL